MKQKSVERKGYGWRRLLAVVLAAALLPFSPLEPVKAAGATEPVSIQVTYGQTQARALLAQINALREEINKKNAADVVSGGAAQTELSQLVYDYGLEQAAMQRAAEVALVYNAVTRPDGSGIASAYPRANSDVKESIGCAGSTAVQIYISWISDVNGTEYQRMTELSEGAVGIGHVTYNGKDYWVAAFSAHPSGVGTLPEDNGTVTRTINVEKTRITSRTITGAPTGNVTINVGDYYDLSKCTAFVQINGHYPMSDDCPLVGTVGVTGFDTSIATYNGSSLYGQGVGKTSVNLTCAGQTASPFTLIVQQPSINQATIDTIADQSYTGYELRPAVKVRVGSTLLTENIDYTLKYENNVNIGTAFVTVTGINRYANTGTKSAYFRIVAPTIYNATITSISDQSYTGYQICPSISVYVNNVLLREGTDYTVSYSNNVNMGTATVTITGIGTYSGTRTTTFRITGPNLYSASIAAIEDQLYTGSDIKPTVTVTVNNTTLRLNTDYYVSYSNNRNVGTATVTVTGRGNYTGTKTTTFRIIGKTINNTTVSSIDTQRYTGDEIRPSVTVKIGSVVLQNHVDYTLSYRDNVQPGTASITITGTGSYSGSKTVTFKIAQASLSPATVKVSNQTYNGKTKQPEVTVKLNGEELWQDEDYEVEYRNNKKPGKATVVITGIGDYSGTKKAYFIIKPKKMTWVSGKPVTNEKGKAAALSWKKDSYASGYELYHSTKKSSGYKYLGTISKNTYTSCTHNRLKAGRHYYKVRSYIVVDGEKYYSTFSKVKGVRIK
ncbi:MAG: hypothetical protein PUK75_08690 [bacterium]|nr:hypothetical protein [bacterium]MDY4100615.1 hypothetical protein [Lachnospiraceae bacterium]